MDDSRGKKTVRQFACRDVLWAVFEDMARELECSVDYLISEAMRQYAKSRKYPVPGAEKPESMEPEAAPPIPPPLAPRPAPPPPSVSIPGPPPRPSAAPPPPMRQTGGFTAPPPRQSLFPGEGRTAAPPPPRPAPATGREVPPPMAPAEAGGRGPTTGQGRAPLYLIFNNQRIPIRKEQFVIGRGVKVCDLAIKDSNVSRKHAVVLFHNGAYYIKDLNSTNGVEFNGMRIDSKRIEDGDAFKICDYELRFSYH